MLTRRRFLALLGMLALRPIPAPVSLPAYWTLNVSRLAQTGADSGPGWTVLAPAPSRMTPNWTEYLPLVERN